MDPAVILKYRRLLTTDFPNSGELEQPAVFVEAIGGKLINCGNTGNYMQLFVQLNQDSIEDIKYRCSCEPSANVAVELLCELSRHQPLSAIKQLTIDDFFQAVGSRDEEFGKKAEGLLELLDQAIERYLHPLDSRQPHKEESAQSKPINWDGRLTPS